MRISGTILLFAISVIFFRCKTTDGGKGKYIDDTENAYLEIRLTDAVAKYDEVNINIHSISINQSKSEYSGWQELEINYPGIYNIIEFRNGADTLLVSCTARAENIYQIRLVLGPGNTVVANGISKELMVSGGFPYIIWLKFDEALNPDIINCLYLDFNAHMSVNDVSGSYNLDPVVRVYSQNTGGTLAGKVLPAEAKAIVWATLDSEIILAIPEPDGRFQMSGLRVSENWTVEFEAGEGTGYKSMVYTHIPITKGGATIFNAVVLEGL